MTGNSDFHRSLTVSGIASPYRFILWVMALCFASTTSIRAQGTFREVFQSGIEAFQNQEARAAYARFSEMAAVFKDEPDFHDPEFQHVFLPLYGMSALYAGEYPVAAQTLSAYFGLDLQTTRQDAALLLGWSFAARQLEDWATLISCYDRFITAYPHHPETPIVQFERILVLFHCGQYDEASAATRLYSSSDAPVALRMRAQLIHIQEMMRKGQRDEATHALLASDWAPDTMPEQAVLAFTALDLGESLMDAGDYEQAIRVYRLVPHYHALVEGQKKQIRVARERMARLAARTPDGNGLIWQSHYTHLIDRMEERLGALESSGDYTAGFLLRYGRCLLHAGHVPEAWVLFRTLADNTGVSHEIGEQAHYHWILASHELGRFAETFQLCLDFARLFPGHELLPATQYLLACAYEDAGKPDDAHRVLSALMEAYPSHKDHSSWWLTRATHLARNGKTSDAIADLESLLKSQAPDSVHARALYWLGRTLAADRRYEEASRAFAGVIANHPAHWMIPECHYRMGAMAYSMKDHPKARSIITDYLEHYPDDAFIPEAKVLLGDILLGEGKLDEAVARFSTIGEDQPTLATYATFQIGKVLRAREDYEGMISHFRLYLDAPDTSVKTRIGEALREISWAMQQLGQHEMALPLLLTTVLNGANEPQSGEFIALLQMLESARMRCEQSKSVHSNATDSVLKSFVSASSFKQWLDMQTASAAETGHWLAFGRFLLFDAMKARKAGSAEQAEAILHRIAHQVPMECMDDHLLGETGLSLCTLAPTLAEERLTLLLALYPHSPHKGLAYAGLAKLAAQGGQPDNALRWINRFQKEYPAHPLAPDMYLLAGDTLQALERWDGAEASYEALLRLKNARGLPHVKALAGLAHTNERRGNPEKAIAYWQRIYTLYRAYTDLVAEAYFESARLFESIGQHEASLRSLDEMLQQEDLQGKPFFEKAKILRNQTDSKPASPTTIPEASAAS